MRLTYSMVVGGVLAAAGLGCAEKPGKNEKTEVAATPTPAPKRSGGKGLAAGDTDPQYAALAEEFKGCKAINTTCAAYGKKDAIGKAATTPESKAKARATFLNWMEEPSSWQVRQAGAHILWTQWLIDDAAAGDTASLKRVVAALNAEPTYGKASENLYTAVQVADVLARFAKNAAGREAVAAVLADKASGFPGARAEVLRLLDAEAVNDAKLFASLRAIAEDTAEDASLRQGVRDSLRHATGENAAWAVTWLGAQVGQPDATWAASSARTLAAIGSKDTYAQLVAEFGKRADDKDFAYYAAGAFTDYFRRGADLGLDVKPGVKALAAAARNVKLDAMTRGAALEALLASKDDSLKVVATALSKDPDAALASRAADVLKRFEVERSKK